MKEARKILNHILIQTTTSPTSVRDKALIYALKCIDIAEAKQELDVDAVARIIKDYYRDRCECGETIKMKSNHIFGIAEAICDKFKVPTDKWISVEDGLPEELIEENGTRCSYSCDVLGFNGENFVVISYDYIDSEWYDNGEGFTENITHWHPLPESLKGE